MKLKGFILTIIILISFVINAQDDVKGKVVAITDGDTFKILIQDSTLIRVRVANIDCPERKQPFSIKAKQFTSDAIFDKEVELKVIKKDCYSRSIAYVFYGDKNLSKELLKAGLAWHFVKYSDDNILQSLEDEAKKNRVGLWIDTKAIAPWEWRSSNKKTAKENLLTGLTSSKTPKSQKAKATQCTGKTKSGKRCKRKTKNANGRCYQH
ncbi:thermonuclease family protein [Mangrovimonas spongiae]|uniref:Nuclease n=1 Tax=Mangrovimonas spongiae TaxID=2494697 RepID=A0A428K0J1_9FLAO|nr:thermonuclease family protein [Mangrovimonas spongiae]RSK39969.1 nuclease [Mangrovimonas spongiae]